MAKLTLPLLGLVLLLPGCEQGHGPIAPGISARLGLPIPSATGDERATFERGRQVALRRFALGDGLGPAFNVTFCASCHERPVVGGSAGLYRNFFLSGVRLPDGTFSPGESAGRAGGVIRLYDYAEGSPARPLVPPETNVVAMRNPIPFFGVGLIAAISGEEILSRADEDDRDGDGISGRANFDQGFVGRFGRKAQTVSIEGFIRGPLFNHLGITTDPLTEEQRARLPVDSSRESERQRVSMLAGLTEADVGGASMAQASAPGSPTEDDDGVDDPELSTEDLFDLISFAMLMAAPEIEAPTGIALEGQRLFDRLGCGGCHTPRVNGTRGPLPIYSDLLLHDMGEALADGIEQGLAEGYEFRTQPLWGIAAVGPYLHDGRATTLEDAILGHGGEAQAARDRFEALRRSERDALIEFLLTLGGRSQYSPGLIPPDEEPPEPLAYGGSVAELTSAEQERFLRGRGLFDTEHGFGDGAGGPRLNGDSCRACHFEPAIGGAGPRGVNVTRHGIVGPSGEFVAPQAGTVLHRTTRILDGANRAQPEAAIFEHRQTPPLFGLGLVEGIPEDAIAALADPYDLITPDGISGRVSHADGGRLGRFGWKAQVPTLLEFVRDAVTTELGMTVPFQEGQHFGRLHDDDEVPDPELPLSDIDLLADYLRFLGPPPRRAPSDPAAASRGEAVLDSVGCALCHVPELPGADGPVRLYSDLLLHEILPEGALGIEESSASMREFRTAPLWGIGTTAPYLHSGVADTLEEAIRAHDGEAAAIRDAYLSLTEDDRAALLAFLETL